MIEGIDTEAMTAWLAERVEVDSPHGHLGTTPPPLALDGATIERPVSGYGAAMPEWVG